ncbi:uncharacterized protein THITE_2112076 [Thermothielavioides terrestris NRRL 8126]|uniref:RING-type E3 ubiquitin transferase n=1 Tax=Thermothielavioides terrestris (strain ATCC 38088 / NRRL 8126) TaxID=578455 RepID=G2R4L8_THETT|nr:uncharacterized protein THITE_2112076 [Thermothielavioides terrestris NRRL 8126]AEO65253.1 hypothetical protein THITE_2112076 [Thermothielavioides terrestris NRRL 8126]
MNTEPSAEDERPQILRDTLQQISSTAAGADTKCCVICLGDLVEQCEARPCRHDNFDYLCLVTWLEARPTCPLCKSDVSEVRYDLGDDGNHRKIYHVPERPADCAVESGRLAASPSGVRHSSRAGLPPRRRPREDEAIRRRRLVYRYQLYSLHVGSNNRQPANWRYKVLSPQLFVTDPELVSRARMWLRRELRVFRFLYTEDTDDLPPDHGLVRRCRPCKAEFLLEYIIAILKSMDMQGSAGQAEELIQEFLGRDNARLLLHELRAWLRSPCKSLSEWDRVVQYRGGDILRPVSQERSEAVSSDGAHSERPTTFDLYPRVNHPTPRWDE